MIRRSGVAELVAGSDEQDIKVVNTWYAVLKKATYWRFALLL